MISFTPKHEFLVGIDSDGCVFDSMELKHKECFIPDFINHYELQGVSKYAREAAEFVNLYSKSRGANRFPALVEQLDWLRRRPEVKARGIDVAEAAGLIDWMARETKLGNPALEKAVAETGDADLEAGARLVAGREQVDRRHGPRRAAVSRTCDHAWNDSPARPTCSSARRRRTRRSKPNGRSTTSPATSVAICGQEIGSKKESLGAVEEVSGRTTR